MLYSQKEERARRFGLALRMGVPILFLLLLLGYYIFHQNHFVISTLDAVLVVILFFIAIYFFFFLIGHGQSESLIDRLTCAFNRSSLLRFLDRYRKDSSPFTIALVRIDNLATINDHYGIDRGDKLLKLFVRLLHDYLTMHEVNDPIIGRYHSGDFVIGCQGEERDVSRLLEDFATTYREIGGIGVEYRYVTLQDGNETRTDLLITHLYDSLTQNNDFSIKREEKQKGERFDISRMESEIVEAVEEGRLFLSYLPAYHFGPERIDLLEVQVRLATKNGGVLPPKKFIPVINRLGLELRFDEQLFETICLEMKKTDSTMRCSFNLSPFSLRSERFADRLLDIAARHRFPLERIVVELFEHRPVKETIRYKMVLESLRSAGIRFALDNFGSQNAGLEYIKRLPVDMIRFDREFTVSYNNPRIAALLDGYLAMCRHLEIETLVKWVDDEETKERFRRLGVDYVQGFAVGDVMAENGERESTKGIRP